MLSGVARRLKRGIDQGMNPADVFSRCQDHVIACARAHVETLVLEAFVARYRALEDGDNKVALGHLCDLYALSTIEADRGWWMEHGRLTSQRSKAISREVADLCRKLRPLADDLVDAFGVPPEVLKAELLDGPGMRPPRLPGLPGLGGWDADPLWGTAYTWMVDHPRFGVPLWKVGVGADLRKLYAAADEIGELPRGSAVLDIPSGSGVALRGLRPDQGIRYVAADISERMLDKTMATAAKHGVAEQVETRVADVGRLPFADGEFDLVVTFTGLHCFPDPGLAVQEMCRVTKPGGRITGSALVTDSGFIYEPLRQTGRVAGLLGPMASSSQIRNWLVAAGMTDVTVDLDGPLAYFTAVSWPPVFLNRSKDATTSASASSRPTHSAPSTDLPGSRSL